VFNNLAKTEAAVIRGVRRIGDLARMQVLASLLSTIVVVSLYAAFHENGIVPALCASASILWLTSCRFSRRIPRMVTTTRWVDFWGNARAVMRMGVAFMWAGLLGSASGFAARTMIYHETGSEGTGIYQSAWALSGLFAQFVISAMGADFYPRLSVVSADNEKMNQYVNEQTEVGILLALPGLVATLMFGSLLIRALYSTKFLPATELLPWFVMGVLAQLISWPAGFIQLAKGASKAFALTETMFHAVHISFICIGLHLCGLKGVAFAFLAAYCWHIGVTLFIAYRLSGFRWSRETATLIIAAIAVSAACLVASHWLSVRAAVVVGSMVTAAVAGACARRLALRLGRQHVIYKLVQAIPGLGSGLQSR
jgi:PST family polysaccharide transporter